jgi:hypothetical protein
MSDTKYREQEILNKAFATDAIQTIEVSGASGNINIDTFLKPQAILNRVFSDPTLRVVTI